VAPVPVDLRRRLPRVVRLQVRGSVVRRRRVDLVVLVALRRRKVDSVVRRRIHLEDPPRGEGVASVVRLRQETTARRLRKVREAMVRRQVLREDPEVTVVLHQVLRLEATVVRRRKTSISS
jgi:hypothetical protein